MYFPKQADSLSYISCDDSMLHNGLRKIASGIVGLEPAKK